MNAIRLRVWVNPKNKWSSKEDMLELAKRVKANHMELMVDFHYSDWWADPGKQNVPQAWKGLSYEEMKKPWLPIPRSTSTAEKSQHHSQMGTGRQ